jgi:Tfp pilus assembly protein PilE
MKKQHGFTTVELAAVLLTLFVLVEIGFGIFVLSHFINKFW